MSGKRYSIESSAGARLEGFRYSDSEVELDVRQTWCDGHRIYCDDISLRNNRPLLFSKRREVIQNLCEHFGTKDELTIFVIDQRDKDFGELNALFAQLIAQGHNISVEHDSEEKRDAFLDEMYLMCLKAGKWIRIDGIRIETVEEYWQWKQRKTL